MTSEIKHLILAEALGKPFGYPRQGINDGSYFKSSQARRTKDDPCVGFLPPYGVKSPFPESLRDLRREILVQVELHGVRTRPGNLAWKGLSGDRGILGNFRINLPRVLAVIHQASPHLASRETRERLSERPLVLPSGQVVPDDLPNPQAGASDLRLPPRGFIGEVDPRHPRIRKASSRRSWVTSEKERRLRLAIRSISARRRGRSLKVFVGVVILIPPISTTGTQCVLDVN